MTFEILGKHSKMVIQLRPNILWWCFDIGLAYYNVLLWHVAEASHQTNAAFPTHRRHFFYYVNLVESLYLFIFNCRAAHNTHSLSLTVSFLLSLCLCVSVSLCLCGCGCGCVCVFWIKTSSCTGRRIIVFSEREDSWPNSLIESIQISRITMSSAGQTWIENMWKCEKKVS